MNTMRRLLRAVDAHQVQFRASVRAYRDYARMLRSTR